MCGSVHSIHSRVFYGRPNNVEVVGYAVHRWFWLYVWKIRSK